MATRTHDVTDYIQQRVTVDERGCWNWKHALNSRGYGLCQRRDWRGLAHRFAYVSLVGEIPDGMQIDHLCMNKACVNPGHLEPVNAKENARRERLSRFGRNYTIFQQSDELWCAVAELPPVEGKRNRKSFRSKSRETAVARIEEWLSATR